jgi:hypothetical protein
MKKISNQVKDRGLYSIAWGLYTSCKESRNHYLDQNMEVEARVFEAYMKRIESKYGKELRWRRTR